MKTMRTADRTHWILALLAAVSAVALLAAGAATAETDVLGWRLSGEAQIGGRTTWGDDDAAVFQRYRDLSDGVLGNFQLNLDDDSGKYYIRGLGENIGYHDQRYQMDFGRYGKFNIDLFYKEIRHTYSTDALTLYNIDGKNSYILPNGVQNRIQNAAVPADQLAIELQAAEPVDLRFRQIEGGGGGRVRINEDLTLFTNYRIQDRNGKKPMAIQFGSPGGTFITFAGPVDDQTNSVDAGLEYDHGPFTLGFTYNGSFYDNDLRDAMVDNPLVATDTATAASMGRESLDPDNSAHSIGVSASALLPTSFPARVTGSFAYGIRLQDDGLLPHTINTAITGPGLDFGRHDIDGRVYTLLGNFVFTANPIDDLSVKLRYRYYDYDNATDQITFDEWVRNDDTLEMAPLTNVRNDYTTHNGDLDVAYDFTRDVTGHVGYGFEYWRRSEDRQVRNLWEHGPEAKVDWRAHETALIQASYSFKMRSGSSYNSLAFFEQHLDPAELDQAIADGTTELSGLRKFDQADRRVQSGDLLAHFTPLENLDFTLSGGATVQDFNNSNFGLTDQYNWHAGADMYYSCGRYLGFSAWYDYEQEWFKQKSRWRPRGFFGPAITPVDNPLNNWDSKNRSQFHTVGTAIDVFAIPDRLDFRFGYEYHFGREKTRTDSPDGYESTAGVNTGIDGAAPFNWPSVTEKLHVVTATGNIHVTENLTLRTQYRYEHFDVDDFRTDSLGPYRGGSDVWLADTIDDYDAHILAVSAVIEF